MGWLCSPCRHSMGTYWGKELTCNWSGNTQPQLSQFAEPLWTDHGLKSRSGVWELISPSSTTKKHMWGMNHWTFPKILACKEKATTTTRVSLNFQGTDWQTNKLTDQLKGVQTDATEKTQRWSRWLFGRSASLVRWKEGQNVNRLIWQVAIKDKPKDIKVTSN